MRHPHGPTILESWAKRILLLLMLRLLLLVLLPLRMLWAPVGVVSFLLAFAANGVGEILS